MIRNRNEGFLSPTSYSVKENEPDNGWEGEEQKKDLLLRKI